MMLNADEIKTNLLKRISTVWNKSEEEAEDLIRFDPVVRLVFNAIIFQFEDIYNQHAEFKKEILSDLAKRLIPDFYYFATPSFGVIKAEPLKNVKLKIKEDRVFSTNRKIKDKILALKYLPVTEMELIPGEIKAIFCNKMLIDFQSKQDNTNAHRILTESPDGDNTLWIGLNIPKTFISSLGTITLFIDYNIDDINDKLFFNELNEAKWTFNNFKCIASQGFQGLKNEIEDFSPIKSKLKRVKQKVTNHFKSNFITLKIDDSNKENITNPSLPNVLISEFNDIIWLSAKCESAISIDFFTRNTIHINAFPIVNFDLKSERLSKNELIKGIRLEENEFFFDIFDPDINNDEFVIRNNRFKSFDAKDLLMEIRTLNRIFNQSRALLDKVRFEEKEMDILNSFSNILSDLELSTINDGLDIPSYNITSKMPFEGVKKFRYLTTFGEHGNGLSSGDTFTYELPGINEKSIVALTSFYGGSNPLSEIELVDKYRYLLLSRDRIVTIEDIKAYCISVMGSENIESIKINKTTSRGIGKIGLYRALKVAIKLNPSTGLTKPQIDFHKKEILNHLENNSIVTGYFIIDIN